MTVTQSALLSSAFIGAAPFGRDSEGDIVDTAFYDIKPVCCMTAVHGALDAFQKTEGEACKKITCAAKAAFKYYVATALSTFPTYLARLLFSQENSTGIAPFAISVLTVAFAKRLGKINSNVILATILFGGLFHQLPSFFSTDISMEMCRTTLKTAFAYFVVTKTTLKWLSS